MLKLNWDEAWIDQVADIGRNAGKMLLKYADCSEKNIQFKQDDSPVTLADMESNEVLMNGLMKLTPGIPIVSEEVELPDYSIRKNYSWYWLIDPLDGTKEYVKGLQESCVCIALICNREVVFSLIDDPFSAVQYVAMKSKGARMNSPEEPTTYREIRADDSSDELVVLQSRSKPVLQGLKINDRPVVGRPMGSALKFCSLASGEAQIYFRWSPFREWDAAAGHLIAEEAGARVTDLQGDPILYNNENLLLRGIVVWSASCSLKQILALAEPTD